MEQKLDLSPEKSNYTISTQDADIVFENSTYEEIADIHFNLPNQCWKKE